MIETVVEDKLCHSCGACSVACPANAISFYETTGGNVFPAIDESRCQQCGLCLKVCAGIARNPLLSRVLPDDPFRGECLGSWVGRSNDGFVYGNAQSGGIVSQLLIDLLERGEVDACAVVKMLPGNPPRAIPFLARGRDDIIAAQKSKYCPVPLLQILNETKKDRLQIAIVGLSCHLHGLRLLEELIDNQSIVKYRIGLICSQTLSYAAVDHLTLKASMEEERTEISFVFRDKGRTGYPGDVTIRGSNGNYTVVSGSKRRECKEYFTPPRCRICFDKMNVLSDLTVGDPWGIEGVDRIEGESVLIARTVKGKELIAKSLEKGSITLRNIAYDEVLSGQKINQESADWRNYWQLWPEFGLKLPGYQHKILPFAMGNNSSIIVCKRKLLRGLKLDGYRSRDALLRHSRKPIALKRLRDALIAFRKLCIGVIRKTLP